MNMRGHGVAVITPFDSKGNIDYFSFEKHLNKIISSKVDYLVILGTTSEISTLSLLEQVEISEFVIRINKNRLPLVIGVGGNNTISILEKLGKFNLSNFQSVLSVCPYYNLPDQNGLFEHFSKISSNCPIPLILYNVPSRSALNINPNTVLQLIRKHNNIIGIKEAGNIEQIDELVFFCGNKIQIISGDDFSIVESISRGAVGSISVIGNAFPLKINKLVEYALSSERVKALQIQNEMKRIISFIYEEGSPAGIKCLLNKMKVCDNNLRLPLLPVSEKLNYSIEMELNSLISN